MRLVLWIIPFALAAGQASAEHDRHHRSAPRVGGVVTIERQPAIPPQPQADLQAVSLTGDAPPKPERARVRVVLPSPFAR